jgi:hypothetical protein
MSLPRKTTGWYYLYARLDVNKPWHKKLNGHTILYWLRAWTRKLKIEFKGQNVKVDWLEYKDGYAFINSNTGARLCYGYDTTMHNLYWQEGEIIVHDRDTMVTGDQEYES